MPARITISCLILIAGFASTALPSLAFARGFRGPSQGQIKQMQAYQKQMQQQYALAVKREQAEQKAFLDKFDANHDGQINGKEKAPAEKFLRERRLGKVTPMTAGSGGFGASSFGSGSLDPIGAFGKAGKEPKDVKKKK